MHRHHRRSPSPRRRSPSPRRRSPSPRRHSPSIRRRRSPSPPRQRSSYRDSEREEPPPRKDTELPIEFSRDRDIKKDDPSDVLERMQAGFAGGPLELLHRCWKDGTKIKIWTRNSKEVRGLCTGFIELFDKHFNMVLRDVDEMGLKPKKGRTPYLSSVGKADIDRLDEAPPKVPKQRKTPKDASPEVKQEVEDIEEEADGKKKKKKKRKRKRIKKKTIIVKRHVEQMFIRGDSVVMASMATLPAQPEIEDEDIKSEED